MLVRKGLRHFIGYAKTVKTGSSGQTAAYLYRFIIDSISVIITLIYAAYCDCWAYYCVVITIPVKNFVAI